MRFTSRRGSQGPDSSDEKNHWVFLKMVDFTQKWCFNIHIIWRKWWISPENLGYPVFRQTHMCQGQIEIEIDS